MQTLGGGAAAATARSPPSGSPSQSHIGTPPEGEVTKRAASALFMRKPDFLLNSLNSQGGLDVRQGSIPTPGSVTTAPSHGTTHTGPKSSLATTNHSYLHPGRSTGTPGSSLHPGDAGFYDRQNSLAYSMPSGPSGGNTPRQRASVTYIPMGGTSVGFASPRTPSTVGAGLSGSTGGGLAGAGSGGSAALASPGSRGTVASALTGSMTMAATSLGGAASVDVVVGEAGVPRVPTRLAFKNHALLEQLSKVTSVVSSRVVCAQPLFLLPKQGKAGQRE